MKAGWTAETVGSSCESGCLSYARVSEGASTPAILPAAGRLRCYVDYIDCYVGQSSGASVLRTERAVPSTLSQPNCISDPAEACSSYAEQRSLQSEALHS